MNSKVYFLPWEKRDKFCDFLSQTDIFENISPKTFTALKIHFGEEGNEGYVKPDFVKQIVKIISKKDAFPFLTDSSALYVGKRSDAYHHLLIANKHGFNINKCDCPVIIADGLKGANQEAVEVNLKHFKEVYIGGDIAQADNFIFINHFKGHEITGFGGALKNIGMGCGSKAGKYAMHNDSKPAINAQRCIACGVCVKFCRQSALQIENNKIKIDIDKCAGCGQCIVNCRQKVFRISWDAGSKSVQERICEYAYGVLKGKISACINFLNHISKYCDCFTFVENKPLMQDIGIIAGKDCVAVDQASYDLTNKVYGKNFFKTIYPDIDPTLQLQYAQELGLGNRDYELIEY